MSKSSTKKILLLFSRNSLNQKMANAEALITLLNADKSYPKNIEYKYLIYEDLVHEINTKGARIYDYNSNIDIADFDLVYHRRWGDCPDLAMACSIYLENKRVIQIDNEVLRHGSMTKLTQYWRFWQNKLPFPATVYVPRTQINGPLIKMIESKMQFPFIMKSATGTRGMANYLINCPDDVEKNLREDSASEFIFQEYIQNDGDFRVFVTGDKVPIVIKRTAVQGSHKNNTSLGAISDLVDIKLLPEKAIRDSIKAAQVFKRNIAGVDLVIDKNDPKLYYFFEVNRSPQIEDSSFVGEKIESLHEYFLHLIQ